MSVVVKGLAVCAEEELIDLFPGAAAETWSPVLALPSFTAYKA